MNQIKILLIIGLSFLLSGCLGNNNQPLVVFQTQFRYIEIPEEFFQACPRYVNPPLSVSDGIDNEQDEIDLGNWLIINEGRYNQCENAINAILQEQESNIAAVERINQRLREESGDKQYIVSYNVMIRA